MKIRFSSLYPSIILQFNLAPNTQIGRIVIPEQVHDKEHHAMYSSDEYDVAKYSRGGEFLDNYMSQNILEFANRWLHLGDIYDVIDDIREYYNFNKYSGRPIDWDPRNVFYSTKENTPIEVLQERNYYEEPVFISYNDPNKDDMNTLREKVKTDDNTIV